MDFEDWTPLRLANSNLLKRIKLAYVFGTTGSEALMVTKKEEVLACGTNVFGCLGLGHDQLQVKPVIVPKLNLREIKGFSATMFDDGVIACAYNSGGCIYYWRKNQIPTLLLPFVGTSDKLHGLKAVCGRDFCLILSARGEVWSFGKNERGQRGRGFRCNLEYPTIVHRNLDGKTVVKIACGSYFSVCVLDNGEVYAWGCNSHGQLGWSNEYSNLQYPNRVPGLNNIVIRKVTCGWSYVLAVSDVGELFSWGFNGEGSLGLGDTTDRCNPTKIKTIGKVIKIAATQNDATSAAMDENLQVYMWGTCGGLKLTKPTKIKYETLHDVFAYFANPRITYKPLRRHFQLESVGQSIRNSFGNRETSDLTIVIENKKIFVHKTILKLRSNYFKLLLQEPWVKEDDKIINLKQNYDGIYAYLQYIYTDNAKATPHVALELMKIADEYADFDLKKICEKSVKHGTTVDNAAYLYNLALKLGCKKLAQCCMSFACNHAGEIIYTAGFSEWDAKTAKEFIRECHKRKLFRSSTE